MTQLNIPIEQIKATDSPYAMPWLKASEEIQNTLKESIQTIGIQMPLLIQDFVLVDGFKRLKIAQNLGIKEVPCVVLLKTTTHTQIADILLIQNQKNIMASSIQKIRFIALLQKIKIEPDTIIQNFLKKLDLQPHETILNQCQRIYELPQNILNFFDEKQFSIKQCLQCTRYKPELIQSILSLQPTIHLTASIFLELMELSSDYQRSQNQPIEKLLSSEEIKNILTEPTQTATEKTKELKAHLQQKRFPILTEINTKMNQIKANLNLPQNISLQWDKSLEIKALTLQIILKDPKEWDPILSKLNHPNLKESTHKLLSFLSGNRDVI